MCPQGSDCPPTTLPLSLLNPFQEAFEARKQKESAGKPLLNLMVDRLKCLSLRPYTLVGCGHFSGWVVFQRTHKMIRRALKFLPSV